MNVLTYDQLLAKIDKFPVFESRINGPKMKEFVIPFESIMPLHVIFQKYFGPDFKSPDENPTHTDKKRSAFWGGIRANQTLYFRDNGDDVNCAMLWPWEE